MFVNLSLTQVHIYHRLILDNLFRCSLEEKLPLVHYECVINSLQKKIHLVFNDKYCHATLLAQVFYQIKDVHGKGGIDASSRLVKEQHRCVRHERPSDLEQLELAS